VENLDVDLVYRDQCGLPIGRFQTVDHWYSIMYFSFSEEDAALFRGIERDRIPLKRAWRRLRLEAPEALDNFSPSFSVTDATEILGWLENKHPSEAFAKNEFVYHAAMSNHVASPPFISQSAVCEVITSAFTPVPLNDETQDRLQWLMYVLNKQRVLLLVQNKINREIEEFWISRDQERIEKLSGAAKIIMKAWGVDEVNRGANVEIAEILRECLHLETSQCSASDSPEAHKVIDEQAPLKRLDWPTVIHVAREYCAGSSVEEISKNSAVHRDQVLAALTRLIYGIDDGVTLSSDKYTSELSRSALEEIETAYRSSSPFHLISLMSHVPLSAILFYVVSRFSPPIPRRVMQEVDRDFYAGF
jgi:hypothetical protein